MKNDIRLYINGKAIEFSKDPGILLNYKEVELHNPTIARNSFTKQITVEGTNTNNDIFGHIWNLERIQGDNFNPIRKTDFELYVNDELFQRGYCKLDRITRTSTSIQYQITLYGNLGQFFYNLSYEDDSSNTKKTLASLTYSEEFASEPDLDFTIDKDNVYQAWGQIAGFGNSTNPRWRVINFIPALNGIPSDFDASKVLINNAERLSGFDPSRTVGDAEYSAVLNGYLTQSGYTLGEMPHELQEWQTRDLRSYNQRPAISMYRIIQACCQPENNGGFRVELDSHFFRMDNPYYVDAWMTLPMLKDLEGISKGETYTITGATVGTSTSIYKPINFNTPSQVSINNVNLNLSVRFTPNMTTSATNLYTYRHFTSKGVVTTNYFEYVKDYQTNLGPIVQMFALGSNGEVLGQSKAYYLGSSKTFPGYNDPMWEDYWMHDYGTEPEYVFLDGYWKKVGGNYVFANRQGSPTDINFSFSAPSNFTSLVLKVKNPRGEWTKYFGFPFGGGQQGGKRNDSNVCALYTSETYDGSGRYTLEQAASLDRITGSWNFVITSMEGVAKDYEGMFSGTKITKDVLLTTEHTPADYLLSYCKLFGLYFYYDSTEVANDPVKYPSGVVHIMDRDTFYTDEVVDLSKYIDWDKKVDITPAMASAKWYKFDVEHTDAELEVGYKGQYGKDYGAQLVNTNYNFDNNTTDLYEDNVFKSGIMALEKDKYYKKDATGLPVYPYNGLKYNLYHRSAPNEEFDTLEIEHQVKTTMFMTSVNPDYEFFNIFPMLQLHGDDNTPVDGDNILVFFKGSVGGNGIDYWLTDDVGEMITLNDATPCWLLTKTAYDGSGREIAKKLNYFPYFTRDLTVFGEYGNIIHSWNFGHPQEVYTPDTYSTDMDSIYDKCWRDYIRDVYDVDTRKLTCYVRAIMDDKPWPYWLRRFYWFENSIWALNEITDLNPASLGTTKMEFIKVQDMNNYRLAPITYSGAESLILDQTSIGCTGGTITGTVRLQSGGGWYAEDNISGIDGEGNTHYIATYGNMHPTSAQGQETTFTLDIPENTGNTPISWTISVEDDFDRPLRGVLIQETCHTGSTLSIVPNEALVSQPSGTTSFTVLATYVDDLTFTTDADWLTLTPTDQGFTAEYQENLTDSARTATITASGTGTEGTITATATITQSGLGSIDVNVDSLVFDYNNTYAQRFQVITQDSWTSELNDNN